MKADLLKPGDTIGIVCPSHVAQAERYGRIISLIEARGFKVKTGENIYKDTYGYIASETERSDDINRMVSDNEVKMIFFGGGECGADVLPYLDYENIKIHPKLFMSFSDGTSILNAVHSKTGLITYYGQAPGIFEDLRFYDYEQFSSHLIKGGAETFISNSKWHSLNEGKCEGTLIGGYLVNFALMLNGAYLHYNPGEKYVLFLEDHEKFNKVPCVSAFITHIEQSGFIDSVAGLLFGHYSTEIHPELMELLKRFGKRHKVPVAYCDDFGHGVNHAILPIGQQAELDAVNNTLRFIRG